MRLIYLTALLLAMLFNSGAKAQFYSEGTYQRAGIFDRMYQPRKTVISGDTVHYRSRWFFPKHAKIQYAGSVGFLSVGVGYHLWDIYEPTFSYGLLNEFLGGSNVTVHTFSLKNSFFLTQKPWFNHFWPKAGLMINRGNTNNTFRKLPPHYPESYYFQNKIHAAPFWGGEWYQPLKDKHLTGWGFYFEFSALDAYLLEAIRTEYVTMLDVWSLAFGITFYFH
ncbi:hypothetical protein [Marinilabilia salmonicolor]|jgi:hypothetical protein|uniref:Outer membrane protein beta-barrel domain-containing protein n=1 Tax=Marinilabilia salmonicolor TaxID=989 RepID=A0A368URM2_9BACT|nr:hypothetical protein [Marinilabilia salmonicolor]RCW31343.1 hypothetical protein DFO77_11860 [Marinilabilia salmonicolor]